MFAANADKLPHEGEPEWPRVMEERWLEFTMYTRALLSMAMFRQLASRPADFWAPRGLASAVLLFDDLRRREPDEDVRSRLVVGLHVLLQHRLFENLPEIVTLDGPRKTAEIRRAIDAHVTAAVDAISPDAYELYQEWMRAWGIGVAPGGVAP